MEISVDKKSNVPLYLQIKNNILSEIKSKKLIVGHKMPTERGLAQKLKISRNTVSVAYQLLEQEGVLISHQGSGTFVAEEINGVKEQKFKDELIMQVDATLTKALERGYTLHDFLIIVNERVQEKVQQINKVKAIFVECNMEQAKLFAGELVQLSGLKVVPVLLSNLYQRDDQLMKILTEAEFLISTYSHVNEVREITADLEKQVLGIAIKPCLDGIVRIARHPKDTKFALLSLSRDFEQKFARNLRDAGIENLNILYSTTMEIEEIKRIAEQVDVIITSSGRGEEITELLKGSDKEIIRFRTSLEPGSLRTVINKLTATT